MAPISGLDSGAVREISCLYFRMVSLDFRAELYDLYRFEIKTEKALKRCNFKNIYQLELRSLYVHLMREIFQFYEIIWRFCWKSLFMMTKNLKVLVDVMVIESNSCKSDDKDVFILLIYFQIRNRKLRALAGYTIAILEMFF